MYFTQVSARDLLCKRERLLASNAAEAQGKLCSAPSFCTHHLPVEFSLLLHLLYHLFLAKLYLVGVELFVMSRLLKQIVVAGAQDTAVQRHHDQQGGQAAACLLD